MKKFFQEQTKIIKKLINQMKKRIIIIEILNLYQIKKEKEKILMKIILLKKKKKISIIKMN